MQLQTNSNTDQTEQSLHLLEIASGSGQHAAYLSQALPQLIIQPSDQEEAKIESLEKIWQYLLLLGG